MFIPSLKRFEYNNESERYEKRYVIGDGLYRISISKDKWNNSNRQVINKWLKQHPDLKSTFPYGYIRQEQGINIYDVKNNGCEFCGKKCSDFKGKKRHMKNCKHKDTVKEEPPSDIVPLENTRIQQGGNIIHNNNNNNITINNNTYVQICDFGNENQKWLTKDLLKCLYLDRKSAVKHLIRNRHFNDRFPENQNIRIDNKNNMNKRLQVYSKGKWRVRETKPVIDLAFINTHEIISDLLNIDEPPFDDDHQSQVIKEFQSTDKFQSMYNRLLKKWEDFGACIEKEDTEFQEYWEYIKTLLLDQKLILDQKNTTNG
jgi:hypothetical protein